MKLFVLIVVVLTAALGSMSAFAGPEASIEPPEKEHPKKVNLSGLTTDEIETYQYGEISTGSLVGGGALGTLVGFGTGHIVYGQYTKKGWIFTLGEFGSLGLAYHGLVSGLGGCLSGSGSQCSNGLGLYMLGTIAFVGVRIWEIVDVWTLPGSHNARYRAIKSKIEDNDDASAPHMGITPIFTRTQDSTGAGLALVLQL